MDLTGYDEGARVLEKLASQAQAIAKKTVADCIEAQKQNVVIRVPCPICAPKGWRRGRGYLRATMQVWRADGEPLAQVSVVQVCAACNGFGGFQ